MLFLKRAEDEINKELAYKQQFINSNRLQMVRSQALKSKRENEVDKQNLPDVYSTEVQSAMLPRHGIKVKSKILSDSKIKNGHSLSLNGPDNAYQSFKQSEMENENQDLESIKRDEYRKILENQIKERATGYNFFKPNERIRKRNNKSELASRSSGNISMIPGINSTSPFLQKTLDKRTNQTLDEHKRIMKKFVDSSAQKQVLDSFPYNYNAAHTQSNNNLNKLGHNRTKSLGNHFSNYGIDQSKCIIS